MKNKRTHTCTVALLGLASLLVSACATGGGPPEETFAGGYSNQETQTRIIHFTAEVDPLSEVRVDDPTDPSQLIPFARSLAASGRHASAAGIFEEGAVNFASRNNELAITCWAASANEYLKAGNMDGFRRAVAALRGVADGYQLAALDPGVTTLFALADYSAGAAPDPSSMPARLNTLLQE
jgi:hypothetical protein